MKFGFGLDMKKKSGLSHIEMSVNLVSCHSKNYLAKMSGYLVKFYLSYKYNNLTLNCWKYIHKGQEGEEIHS